ncbi:AAA family ATPase [Solidesulfovibrio sp.]|uniref:AAA family ATPase n=1 Tax=Solidesulfovibrio sp. TaxID=2910990 RepID=UPI002B21A070|nr:AAA family ATPase [Solidesulfovibrio sp.]MEA4857767.1 AAA family ATPase [Solidesulfovibrio sp.]
MIAQVTAHNFKGATFQAPLGGKVLVVGPNGAGKSSRSQALQLAVLGYVPGAGKQNAAILEAFHDGKGKDLRAGVVLESGKKLERRFTRSERTGAVSQEMYAGGIKCSAPEFARALADVTAVDLSVFLALSDAKKIDELFRLFPPEGNVRDIAAKIEAQAKRIVALEREERDATALVANVTAKKASIQLPAGTMADKQAEIDKAEADLKQARADLEAERIAAARIEAQAEAEARQAEQPAPAETAPLAHGGAPLHCASGFAGAPLLSESAAPATSDVTAILERILTTMDRAGCDVCAAKMIIKQELAKARKALDGRAAA